MSGSKLISLILSCCLFIILIGSEPVLCAEQAQKCIAVKCRYIDEMLYFKQYTKETYSGHDYYVFERFDGTVFRIDKTEITSTKEIPLSEEIRKNIQKNAELKDTQPSPQKEEQIDANSSESNNKKVRNSPMSNPSLAIKTNKQFSSSTDSSSNSHIDNPYFRQLRDDKLDEAKKEREQAETLMCQFDSNIYGGWLERRPNMEKVEECISSARKHDQEAAEIEKQYYAKQGKFPASDPTIEMITNRIDRDEYKKKAEEVAYKKELVALCQTRVKFYEKKGVTYVQKNMNQYIDSLQTQIKKLEQEMNDTKAWYLKKR
jgi:hypothetical protein